MENKPIAALLMVYISFLERSDYKCEGLLLFHVPVVDVQPDVHLPVLLLVVDPPGQRGQGELKAHDSILAPRNWQLNISTIFLTENNKIWNTLFL